MCAERIMEIRLNICGCVKEKELEHGSGRGKGGRRAGKEKGIAGLE
jgi:hypothetical protein